MIKSDRTLKKYVILLLVLVCLIQSCNEPELIRMDKDASADANLQSSLSGIVEAPLVNSTIEQDPDVVMDFMTKYPFHLAVDITLYYNRYSAYTVFQKTNNVSGIVLWESEFGAYDGTFAIDPDTGAASVSINTPNSVAFTLKLYHSDTFSSLVASNVQGVYSVLNLHHNEITPVVVPNSIWDQPVGNSLGYTFDRFEFGNAGRVVQKPYGTQNFPNKWSYGVYTVDAA
jgi:hypothetical protein